MTPLLSAPIDQAKFRSACVACLWVCVQHAMLKSDTQANRFHVRPAQEIDASTRQPPLRSGAAIMALILDLSDACSNQSNRAVLRTNRCLQTNP